MATPPTLIPADDGLVARASGVWAQDKLFFLGRYMDIFSTGMKSKWPRRIYVDLMAGPGRCRTRDTGEEFQGSPVLALQTKTPFAEVVLIESDPEAFAALRARVEDANTGRVATLIPGDCNDPAVIDRVRGLIGSGLALLFVDLIGLNVRFETIRAITRGLHVDLVVTFPDMDVKRNADQADRDRWTAFFGGTRWQDAVARWACHRAPEGSVPAMLVNLYRRELRDQLGYAYSAATRPMVNSKRATLYRPLFASRHELGLKFWNSISKRDRNGQGDLFV